MPVYIEFVCLCVQQDKTAPSGLSRCLDWTVADTGVSSDPTPKTTSKTMPALQTRTKGASKELSSIALADSLIAALRSNFKQQCRMRAITDDIITNEEAPFKEAAKSRAYFRCI